MRVLILQVLVYFESVLVIIKRLAGYLFIAEMWCNYKKDSIYFLCKFFFFKSTPGGHEIALSPREREGLV